MASFFRTGTNPLSFRCPDGETFKDEPSRVAYAVRRGEIVARERDLHIMRYWVSRWISPIAAGQGLCSLFSAWFPGGATLFRPYWVVPPAPLRTVLALFTHTAPHVVLHVEVYRLTLVCSRGNGKRRCIRVNCSQVMRRLPPRRFNHWKSSCFTSARKRSRDQKFPVTP